MITNQVILVGYVGTDPAFKKTKNDQFFVTFSLRTHDSWKDKDGNWQTQTN
jgi:single-stranded DNA-binding protein